MVVEREIYEVFVEKELPNMKLVKAVKFNMKDYHTDKSVSVLKLTHGSLTFLLLSGTKISSDFYRLSHLSNQCALPDYSATHENPGPWYRC